MTEPSNANCTPQAPKSVRVAVHPAQLYEFLQNYIAAHHYAPTTREIATAMHTSAATIVKALRRLECNGKLTRHPWPRGITLVGQTPELILAERVANAEPIVPAVSLPITVEHAIDWKVIAKTFQGVPISRLTAAQVARYFRKRCIQVGRIMAEREANLLLGLRFPELFLERRTSLANLPEFLDVAPESKRGCRSCGKRYTKVRPNQRYCSARCRRREKRKRREATAHGKLLRKQQNKRYRLLHLEQERARRREWIASKVELRRAQRLREGTRRRLQSASNRKKVCLLPSSIAALVISPQLQRTAMPKMS